MHGAHHSTHKSLRASIHEGAAASVMLGAGETYLSTLAIFLGASALQVAILATVPPLMGALCQLFGVFAVDRNLSRRRTATQIALCQGITLLPIALLPLMAGINQPIALIILSLIYYGCAGFVAPIWNSLIGDLVPIERRGRFFGARSKRSGLATFAAVTLAGGFLEISRHEGQLKWGFVVIFFAACLGRLTSSYWLSRHEDPPYQVNPSDKFSFFEFISRAPHSNFAKFVFFVGAINFGLFLAGPFFSVYMLRTLQLPYANFTLLIALALLSQYLTLGRWGEISDLFGNRKILAISALGLCISPVLWLVSSNIWYLAVVQLFSGFVMAGFNLAAGNFLFDAVSPPKRARCVAYQSIVNGVFVCAGGFFGGYLSDHVSFDFFTNNWLSSPHSPFLTLFLISGAVRLLAVAVFLPLFREVREVPLIKHRHLLYRVVHLRPFTGATFSPVPGKED